MFGGLFGGSSKGEKAKLDAVQQLLDDHKDDKADKDLDLMLQAGQDLKSAFQVEAARGSPSAKVLLRIESLSDGILSNLERRITEELLSEDRGPAIANKCATIAKELDEVRATKASTLIVNRTEKMQEKLAASLLKGVVDALQQIGADQKTVKHANIVENSKLVVEAVEAAHAKAPSSKAIAGKLIEFLVKLARFLLNLLVENLSADPSCAGKAKRSSERLDAIADKLVGVLESTWDPPLAPQVEKKLDEAIKKVMAHNVQILEAEITKGGEAVNRDDIIKIYTELKPWWYLAADVAECSTAFQAVSEKADAVMIDLFSKKASIGDKATVDILLKFAEDMDMLTAHFDGIEISKASLRAKMMEIGLVDVGPKLDALDTELAKKPGEALEVATMTMALTTLEGLKPLWKMSAENDPSLVEKLQGTLGVLEGRVAETVTSAPVAQALHFLKAGIKYDSLCVEMGLEERGLQKSLTPLVANIALANVEEEAAKTEGVDIGLMLKIMEEFKSDKSPVLKSSIGDDGDLKARVQNAIQSLEDLIITEFKSAAEIAEKKRIQELGQFAGRFDALCLELQPDMPEEKFKLVSMLQLMACVGQAEKQIAAGGELDCVVVNKALEGIGKLCQPPKAPSEAIVGRVQALKVPLKDALFARTLKADEATMGVVLECAKKVEIAVAAVEQREATEEGGELCDALKKTRAVNGSFQKIEVEFGKESGRDPNVVLKALQGLKSAWTSVAEIADFNMRLVKVFGELEKRLCAACQTAFVDGDLAKVARLLRYGRKCDDVRESADGDAQICEALAATVVKYNLGAIKEELGKDAGFHPKMILDALRALHPHFQCLGENNEDGRKTLSKLRATIAKRMGKAWDDAVASDDKRKMEGLQKFASEFDSAFADIDDTGGFVENLENRTDAPGEEEDVGNEEEEVWLDNRAVGDKSNEKEIKPEDDEEGEVWLAMEEADSPSTAKNALKELSDADLAQLISMLPSPLKDQYVAEQERRNAG